MARGLEIIDRNFRTRYGELDLVARDERYLVFCEVKTRIVRRSPGPLGRQGRWVRSPPSGTASGGACEPWRASG